MVGSKSVFTENELNFMEHSIGLVLSDTKDYSEDEILEFYEKILAELPMEFDADGYPLETGRLFESIVDKFYDL